MLARIRRRLFSSFTLSFFLTLVLVIALAACASTTARGTSGSTTSPQTTSAPTSPMRRRALLAPAPLWTLEHLTKTLGIRPSLLALVILFSLLARVCSASFAR